jgi:hypothetical protein
MWAMADRARKGAEERFRWWDKASVKRALAEDEQTPGR